MFNTTKNGTDVPPGASVEELSGQELYQAGVLHFKNRDYAAARACFERHLEQSPADASACHLLARVYYHQNKDLDKAEECLKRALEIDHSSLTAYLETLGIIYLSQGRYGRAEEVFEYALSEDKKDDVRHTYALEFHLNLAKKKNRSGTKPAYAEAVQAPEFLVTDMDRWHTRKRQSFFLLPSIILHAIIFLLVGYLSTHNIASRVEKEDFTYVDVEQPAEVPQEEATEKPSAGKAAPAPAPEEQAAEKPPAPAPVSPGKEVKTSGSRKESSAVAAPAPMKETGQSGRRGTVGQKSAAGMKGGATDKTALAKAMPGDKGSQVRAHAPKMSTGEVDLVKKSLGADISSSRAAGGPKEAAVGGLQERSGGAAASGADGIFLGDSKTGKASKWDKERRAELKGGSMEARSGQMAGVGGEKSMDLGMKRERPSAASSEEARLAARPLGIAAGPSTHAAAGSSAGAPRSLDRGEQAASSAGQASVFGAGPLSGKEAAPGGGKVRGDLGYAASEETSVPVAGGNERRADLTAPAAGRRFASADAVPQRRGLDMPAGGRPGAGTQAAPGGGARESIASLERRGAGGVPAQGMEAAGLASGRPGTEGYRAGAPAGKGVNPKALGGQPGDEAPTLGALLEKTARRVGGALGIGGAGGWQGPSGADLRRAGGMEGLAGSGGYSQGGSGQGSGGAGTGGGVRLGSGERGAGAAQPGTARAADVGSSGQGRAIAGGKKMTEGALGTPGGSDAQRLASAGGTQTRPVGVEKRSGVGRGRALAKNTIGPSVSITSPTSGRTNRLTQVVTGTVTDTRTKKAVLTVNNDSRVISVENGRFESTVSLGKGRNTITVMAFDLDGNMGKDIIVLDYAEPTESASITIASPRQGQVFDVSERSVVSVKGTIGDPSIKKAKLIFNGNPMDIVVNRGYFDQKVALTEEQNTLLVEAVSADGMISRSGLITVSTMNVKPKDIMVILSWDKPHADFDLHVYGPMGGHTFYKSPNIYESKDAIAGGQLEQDAKGNFGPEVYTQDRADKGVYTISSNYYYSGGDGDAHATLTVILYGDNPSRRIMRVFGPHLQVDTKTGEDTWEVTRFKMPEGIFLED